MTEAHFLGALLKAGAVAEMTIISATSQDLGVWSEESSWKGPRPRQGWARKREAPNPQGTLEFV